MLSTQEKLAIAYLEAMALVIQRLPANRMGAGNRYVAEH